MQKVAPLRNSNFLEERRHHVRHRLTSIVYVGLGPGNGGIIVSLGTGGLSLHAATKLNADAELDLRFRLDPNEDPIEAVGRVAWLGPTQKEAGLAFKNLPVETEQRIANWIAAQQQPASATQLEIDSQPKSPSMAVPVAPLSVRDLVPASPASEKPENAPSSFGMGIAHRRISKSFQLNDFSSGPSELPQTTSPSSALAFSIPEERFERPSDKLLRSPVKRREVFLEPEKPAPTAQEIVQKDSQLTSLMPPPAKVIEVSRQAPQANDSAASQLRQQRKLGFTVAACSAGILVLMLTVMKISRPAPAATTATVEPASMTQTEPVALTDQGGAITSSADLPPEAYYDLLPILPTHQPMTAAQHGGWSAQLEALLGMDVSTKLNPEILALPVWTVQHSGYYYCADSLNSETPQAGALMWQGEALQSGYQPKLGTYCH